MCSSLVHVLTVSYAVPPLPLLLVLCCAIGLAYTLCDASRLTFAQLSMLLRTLRSWEVAATSAAGSAANPEGAGGPGAADAMGGLLVRLLGALEQRQLDLYHMQVRAKAGGGPHVGERGSTCRRKAVHM